MFIEIFYNNLYEDVKRTINIDLIESFAACADDDKKTVLVLKGDEFAIINETYDEFSKRLANITTIVPFLS